MTDTTSEKIFDALIAEALAERWDNELRESLEDRNYDDRKFSQEFEKNFRKIRNSIGRKNRIRKAVSICAKFAITAAAAMGIIFGGLLTRSDVYAAVSRAVREVFEKYDTYTYEGEIITADTFDNSIRLGYIPTGFYLTKGEYYPAITDLTYETEDGDILFFSYIISEGLSSDIDNEHHTYSNFTINGTEYHYYEAKSPDWGNMLFWYSDGYEFTLHDLNAQISLSELIETAENIKY